MQVERKRFYYVFQSEREIYIANWVCQYMFIPTERSENQIELILTIFMISRLNSQNLVQQIVGDKPKL